MLLFQCIFSGWSWKKVPLAGICVVLVLSLVRVLVCVVLDLFVEHCDGVVV